MGLVQTRVTLFWRRYLLQFIVTPFIVSGYISYALFNGS